MTLLRAEGITKEFGGLVALHDAGVVVDRGKVAALIGPNGAGKTTLFNCISGHLRPDAGCVWLGDREMTGAPAYRMAEHGLARTFQNLELFPDLTVLENVLVGRHLTMSAGPVASMLRLPRERHQERRAREQALAALDRVGAGDLADRPVGQLPYGKQRLVEIARALALEPSVLLLDEPAAGLSAGEADNLGEMLQGITADEVGILLVEHDMRTVMALADEITVLDAGRVIAIGRPEEIQANPAVVAAYLGVEAIEDSEQGANLP
ncbi:MAG: ABC transporter ATP-binding protein [Candidatus Dormibacteria bacterium]